MLPFRYGSYIGLLRYIVVFEQLHVLLAQSGLFPNIFLHNGCYHDFYWLLLSYVLLYLSWPFISYLVICLFIYLVPFYFPLYMIDGCPKVLISSSFGCTPSAKHFSLYQKGYSHFGLNHSSVDSFFPLAFVLYFKARITLYER